MLPKNLLMVSVYDGGNQSLIFAVNIIFHYLYGLFNLKWKGDDQ